MALGFFPCLKTLHLKCVLKNLSFEHRLARRNRKRALSLMGRWEIKSGTCAEIFRRPERPAPPEAHGQECNQRGFDDGRATTPFGLQALRHHQSAKRRRIFHIAMREAAQPVRSAHQCRWWCDFLRTMTAVPAGDCGNCCLDSRSRRW